MVKTKKNIPDLLRAITLITGLLTASVSFFEYGIQEKIREEFGSGNEIQEKGGHSQAENEDSFYVPDYQATISSFQLHIDQAPALQDYIPGIVLIKKWYQRELCLSGLAFFKTLFQHIISPNAP